MARKRRDADDEHDGEDYTREAETGTRVGLKVNNGDGFELVAITSDDLSVVRIALDMLTKAVERARKALQAIGYDDAVIAKRDSECAYLLDLITRDDDRLRLGVPSTLIPTVRVALALEYEQVSKVLEAQITLSIDADETRNRSKQISRILEALDVAQMGGDTVEGE